MQSETYPEHSNVMLQQRGVIKKVLNLNNCTLEIKASQVSLEITGDRNRIVIDESAGKVSFKGNENQIEIRKSWLTCALEGSQNIFNLIQTQFLLASHHGEANIIPGVLGDQHIPLRRRLMHDRIMNMRIALKQRSQHVKKLLPHLLKSAYNSDPRECSICYDDIKQGDEVTSLFCFHFFHSLCIEACLETAVKCPVCSLDLLKVINDEVKNGNFVQVNGDFVMKESIEAE